MATTSIWDAGAENANRENLTEITWDLKSSTGDGFASDYQNIAINTLNIVPNPNVKSTNTSVRCSHSILDPGSIRAMTLALGASKTITTLAFSNCAISTSGLLLLQQSLPSTQINSLAIDYNGSAASVEALASFAKPIPNFTSLSLRGNNLGAVGTATLCDALEQNTTLTNLTLYRNGVGDVGACSLARLFRINKTIKHISVGSNGLGPHGLNELMSSVTRYTLDQSGLEARQALSAPAKEEEESENGGGKKKGAKKGGKKGGKKGKGEKEEPVLDEILSGGVVIKSGEENGEESEGAVVAAVGTVCRASTSVVRLDVSYNADIGVAGDPVVQHFINAARDDLILNKLNGIDLMGCGLSTKCEQECGDLIRAVRAEGAGDEEESGDKKDDKKKKKK
jgi:hypothetical protein